MWRPDYKMAKQAIDTILGKPGTPESLEAFGKVIFSGLKDELKMSQEAKAAHALFTNEVIKELNLLEFHESALLYSQAVEGLATSRDAEAWETVVKVFKLRDKIEMIGTGAAFLNPEWHWPWEWLQAIDQWEETVDKFLWKLIRHNDDRAKQLQWVEPKLRQQLWWWRKGHDFNQYVMDAAGDLARLLAMWPQAEFEFNDLIETYRSLL